VTHSGSVEVSAKHGETGSTPDQGATASRLDGAPRVRVASPRSNLTNSRCERPSVSSRSAVGMLLLDHCDSDVRLLAFKLGTNPGGVLLYR
jgi:hypothetical protein